MHDFWRTRSNINLHVFHDHMKPIQHLHAGSVINEISTSDSPKIGYIYSTQLVSFGNYWMYVGRKLMNDLLRTRSNITVRVFHDHTMLIHNSHYGSRHNVQVTTNSP